MKRLIAFLALSCASAFAADVVDVKVKVLDGFGGDTGSVITRCQTKVGATYDPVTVSRDVTSLKDSGEFEEIEADAQRLADGVEVTFFVKRKFRFQAPLIVKGCDYFSESRVAKESELKDGFLYGEGDLAAAAAKVRLAYQKKYYLDAKVTPLVEPIAVRGTTVRLRSSWMRGGGRSSGSSSSTGRTTSRCGRGGIRRGGNRRKGASTRRNSARQSTTTTGGIRSAGLWMRPSRLRCRHSARQNWRKSTAITDIWM